MSEEPESPAEVFGKEIKYAREARGWSQQELADKLFCGQPYISKVETGQQLPGAPFAEQCDRVFDTPGVYARMRQRAADAPYPAWFVSYLKLEREAATICDYSNAFIMGILQTPEYAAAVNRSAHPRETEAEIKARVELRMQRREIFEGGRPPLLWVILHEAVLRSAVGGPGVMRGQLQHLTVAAESPHIVIQVFPFSAGAPSRGVPFIVLTRQDGTIILYEETYERGQVDDSAEAVAEAQAAYERLRADALSPADSLALIRRVTEEYAQ